MQETLLATEPARQHGGTEDDVGERVREGLMQARLGLIDRAISRLHPE